LYTKKRKKSTEKNVVGKGLIQRPKKPDTPMFKEGNGK